jgi:hypothetical protein
MTTATALVIPALRDVRDAQATVADTFRAHYAVTPDGPYRQSLRQRADDAREHLRRLDERLEDLQPRRPVLHPLNWPGRPPESSCCPRRPPWEIRERLRQTDPTLARKVLDYERDREQRPTITTAAERAAGTTRPAGPTTR